MPHVARTGLCAVVAACALVVLTPALDTARASRLPPQGLYDWCAPAQSPDGCAARLQRVGQAGFSVINNGWVFNDPTEQQIRAYARTAAAAGVRVMWPLNNLQFQRADPSASDLLGAYPDLAAHCGCSDNQGLFAYLMGVLRSLPNTWGYYLWDEPKPNTHAALVDWVSRVKALDPEHPRLIVGCGICSGGPDANVAWMADLDIALGTDAYPVLGGPPNPSHAYASVRQNVASLDRAATAAGRQQAVVIQAWRWGDSAADSQSAGIDPATTRFPTREEIEAQRNAAVENAHPDLILWFVLTQVIGWEPGQTGTGWSNPPDTGQRWANLVGGAFAPLPSATVSSPGVPSRAPASRLNRAPLARFTLRRGPRSRLAGRFSADAGRSRDMDGSIVRYVWTLNGRRLAAGRSRRCSFRVRRGTVQRLTLTVIDNRGARAAAKRRFSVTRGPRAR